MTYFKQGPRRAAIVGLTTLAALAPAPLSMANNDNDGGGGGSANPVDRVTQLGWQGLYLPGVPGSELHASSQYLTARSTKGVFHVEGSVTVWDRATDGACAKVVISVLDGQNHTLWTQAKPFRDCVGVHQRFKFDTGTLSGRPAKVVRRIYLSRTQSVSQAAAF